ncbi:MAG: copper resistance protein NlpE N-terminal domain-containing protein [Lysobacteraceae bacterium]
MPRFPRRPFLALTAALALAACAGVPTEGIPPAVGDTSANALDWAGRYAGVLPCADCEGIETRLDLAEDQTYVLRTRYLGKSERVFEEKGRFRWDRDGRSIRLDGFDGGPGRYLVGENQLFHLDSAGQRIEGPLAGHYRLSKQVAPNTDPALLGQRWRLVEAMGQPVTPPTDGAAPHLQFDADGRIHGNAGCNGFFGGYVIDGPTRLRFEGVGSTLMACVDMQVETVFLDALGKVDNYAVGDGRLSLHRARMAPLLRFEAEPAADQ